MYGEWNIQAPRAICVATGNAFTDEEKIHSLLLWKEGAYERLDYCEAAWPPAPMPENLLSSWKGVYKTPPPPPPETLNKDDAEGLLRRLLAERDPVQAHACYILGLMLERKRVLKEIDRKEIEGGRVLIYEHLPSGETWVIPYPILRLEEVGKVQEQVAGLLGGLGGSNSGNSKAI